jgi:hypothetical protein
MKQRVKKKRTSRKISREAKCVQCGRMVQLDDNGWLINGAKEFLCGHACFDKRRKPISWEDL